MKILQVNIIYKEKSTGRTCWEIEKTLEKRGDKSLTIHQVGDTSDPVHSYVVNGKMGYYFHKLMSRITGLDGYYSYYATKKAIKKIKEYDPDIIHLRNLHGGYLHLPTFFKYLSQAEKPVVYNLHDTWPYTGKCSEYDNVGCIKWQSECKSCTQYKDYPVSYFFDRSRKIFNDKKRWYKGINNLTVVGVSEYMKTEANRSILFSGREIKHIYNWVDLDKFHPYDSQDTRKRYDLHEGFLVVGVSSYWKKNTEFPEICELARELGDKAQICLVGGENIKLPYSNMKHIPTINSISELGKIYSAADAFVSLSTAESFGKVAAEALACGTPIVVYNTTGIKEIADNDCGYVVEKHNISAMIEKLMEINKQGKSYYTKNCRKRAEELFSYETNAAKVIKLYKELLCERI